MREPDRALDGSPLSWQPVAVALALTLLGAFKPIIIDETIYLRYAEAFAQHPTDPYAFEIFWYNAPEPASQIIVPPVVPYYLALSRTLFGSGDVVAKLSMYPFALAFAFGLAGLLRRLAPGCVGPLLWMTALSPVVLPSFNLMLDVPMLGLSLLALLTFVRACEGSDVRRAIIAGLLAGLAMQTKYSGVLVVATIGAYALLAARPVLGILSGACAIVVFVGWEAVMNALYGESHFLHGMAVIETQFGGHHPVGWAMSFLSLIGAVLPTVGWLALVALRPSRVVLGVGWIAIALAFATLALLPKDLVALAGADYPIPGALRPELFVFVPMGFLVAVAFATLAAVELRRLAGEWPTGFGRSWGRVFGGLSEAWRSDAFALAWLTIEVIGFFAVSPYPAARRVIGMGIAATVLAGRVASRGGERARKAVMFVAGFTAALGFVFFAADYSDARARRESVEQVVERTGKSGCLTTWYVGHWGFQHYAERAGMQPVVPEISRLERGDCLAFPVGVYMQQISLSPRALRELPALEIHSAWPWRSIPSFYVGPVPLRAQSVAHVRVRMFRVVQPWVPRKLRSS